MSETLAPADVEQMLGLVRPDWELIDATPAEAGVLPVYHLTVDRQSGRGECVLKAASEGGTDGVDVEARLLAGLAANTEIPVPTVYGSYERHADLRTPFFLMSAIGGETVPFRSMGSLDERAHRRLARTSGRHLAALHEQDVVEGFGFLERTAERPLTGEQPPADWSGIGVAEPRDWRHTLSAWTDPVVEGLGSSRFTDLQPRLERRLRGGIDALSGPFEPVLARIDHGLHNVRVEPETGRTVGAIDWAFTIAATPAYDLVTVERTLAGGNWAHVEATPDRLGAVREALRAGYREAGGGPTVLERLQTDGALYDLLSLGRAMVHLDAGLGTDGMTDDEVETVAATLRRLVTERC